MLVGFSLYMPCFRARVLKPSLRPPILSQAPQQILCGDNAMRIRYADFRNDVAPIHLAPVLGIMPPWVPSTLFKPSCVNIRLRPRMSSFDRWRVLPPNVRRICIKSWHFLCRSRRPIRSHFYIRNGMPTSANSRNRRRQNGPLYLGSAAKKL